MKPLLFALPGNEALAAGLGAALDLEAGALVLRRFPDGEDYVRVLSPVAGRDVLLLASLARPAERLLPLLFTAATLRDLGAARVGLIAPYLAYMRQDRRFQEGEGVTSAYFARLLSPWLDWLATVDPHLHRRASLAEIYSIPTAVAHAAPLISRWIKRYVAAPLLVGPDSESAQWVAAVARDADAPHIVLEKRRRGDRDVTVSLPDLAGREARTPVLIDDIISTARTMIETVRHLRAANMAPPLCVGIHGVFAGNAYEDLMAAGAGRIVTANTIAHHSNAIDVAPLLATALRQAGFLAPLKSADTVP
ncbi:MAG: ribose-phosphate pyrophosphokinase [Pseudomonadota bacterium]